MRHQHLASFSEYILERSTFITISRKIIDLAAPKMMLIDTYLILYSDLAYAHFEKGNNQH